jgi:hypothetical protein
VKAASNRLLVLSLRQRRHFPLTNATLALQPKTFGEGSTVVAKMAQPTAEPVEDYDYEALPPNFSLIQNMAAGAFAGIAV